MPPSLWPSADLQGREVREQVRVQSCLWGGVCREVLGLQVPCAKSRSAAAKASIAS